MNLRTSELASLVDLVSFARRLPFPIITESPTIIQSICLKKRKKKGGRGGGGGEREKKKRKKEKEKEEIRNTKSLKQKYYIYARARVRTHTAQEEKRVTTEDAVMIIAVTLFHMLNHLID